MQNQLLSNNKRFTYWRTQILSLMTISYAAYYLVRKNMSVVNKSLSDELGYTTDDLGNILAASYIVYGVSKFMGGILADRLKPGYILFIGLIMASILNIFIGFTNAFALAVIWSLVNLFQGFGVPSCSRIIANWFHVSETGRAWGVWNASHQIGGAIILVFGAILVKKYGWESVFIIPGIISIVIAIIALLGIKDKPQNLNLSSQYDTSSIIYSIFIIAALGLTIFLSLYIYPKYGLNIFIASIIISFFVSSSIFSSIKSKLTLKNQQNETQHTNRVSTDHNEKEDQLTTLMIFKKYILYNKILWVVCFANLFIYIVRLGILDWGPRFLEEAKGFSLAEAAGITAISDISGIFGAFCCGYVSDIFFRGRRVPVAFVFMLCLSLCCLWFIYLPAGASYWSVTLCLTAIGFFVYGPLLMVAVIASDFAEHKATGTAVGLTGLFGYIGSVLCSKGTGYIVDQYNWDVAFSFWLVSACIGTVLFLFIWKAKPKED